MPVFNFPQFEHEPFWSYLLTVSAYRAPLNQNLEKRKISEVIVMGLNSKSRSYVESICLGSVLGLLNGTQDEV